MRYCYYYHCIQLLLLQTTLGLLVSVFYMASVIAEGVKQIKFFKKPFALKEIVH